MEKRSTNSGCYSVEPALGNCGYGPEGSGGLSETPASGNRGHVQKIFDEEWWSDEGGPEYISRSATMSVDSKPVETDGKRGRYREITVDSGAGESVCESR